jgi:hypothetical protein
MHNTDMTRDIWRCLSGVDRSRPRCAGRTGIFKRAGVFPRKLCPLTSSGPGHAPFSSSACPQDTVTMRSVACSFVSIEDEEFVAFDVSVAFI